MLRPDVSVVVEIELWQSKHHVLTATSRPVTGQNQTTFRAGVHIPADFLNEQPYQARFRLKVTSVNDTDPVAVVAGEGRLDFAAMNAHPQESVWNDWQWARHGMISPRLAWTVTAADIETSGQP
jgi:hypothetical protein